MGISIFMIMMMMVRHELTFDQFHKKGARIFHVIQEFQTIDGSEPEIFTALPLADALVDDISGITNAISVHAAASTWMTVDGKRFFEEEGVVASSSFFEFFDFTFIYGSPERALSSEYSIVIDQNMSQKLFGKLDPIGRTVDIERYGLFTVSGVIEEVPSNSFIQFDFVLTQNYDTFFQQVHPRFPAWFQSWRGDPAATFVMLDKPEDADRFETEVSTMLAKYLNTEDINPHKLINLYDLHFGLDQVDGSINEYVRGDRSQLNLLILVASLVLFMACFNFVNLLTARSITRSKEVGIRKSIGAVRGQIFFQFMAESSIQVACSFILATGWILLILPSVERLTGIQPGLDADFLLSFSPHIALLFVLLTLLSGIYPALVISRFVPRRALASLVSQKHSKFSLRNVLLTIQYGIVIIMISSLIIVNRQFRFMTDKPLGFEVDQLLIVEVNGGGVRDNFGVLKQDLLANPKVSAVSGLTRMISGYRTGVDVAMKDPTDHERQKTAQFYGMDSDGIEALELRLLLGERPSGNRYLDSTMIYLNETAASWYGDNDIIGQWIEISDDEGEDILKARVAGIIEDFHYSSLHEPIGPVVIGYLNNPFQSIDDIVIRIRGDDLSETLAYIEEVHNRYDENDVMTWEFLDDMVVRAYKREMIIRDVFVGAASIAFAIAVIGMISLLSLTAIEKTKELGIRKILGANYIGLITLQAKSFMSFASIAAMLGIPIVWVLSSNWLDSFAYRAGFSVLPFAAAIGTVVLSTLIIVWIINHSVISRNPVQSLRHE